MNIPSDTETKASSIELAAIPESARAARAYIVKILTMWNVPRDVIKTAELLGSELATNAITHGRDEAGTFRLDVRSVDNYVLIDVADRSPGIPVVRPATDDIPDGRGLSLVAN